MEFTFSDEQTLLQRVSLDLSLMIMALNPDKSTPGVMPAMAPKIGRPLLSLVG